MSLGSDKQMQGHMIQPKADTPRRVEGRDKVMGRAHYAGDFGSAELHQDMDVAVAVTSTQASGRILDIETAAVLAAPGVRAVLTHQNAARLNKVLATNGAEIGDLLPLQDDQVHYAGQCVALIIADTLEHARAAASLLKVRYSEVSPDTAFTLTQGQGRAQEADVVGPGDKGQVSVGQPDEAYQRAAHKIDLTFTTSPHHHNAMEPGAVVAAWSEDGQLTVWLPTQFSYGDALILSQAFGFKQDETLDAPMDKVLGGQPLSDKVRVVSTLMGGAFGGKNANIHLLLAPLAAKLTGRPVKLVLTRPQTFTLMPFRGESEQHLRLAADDQGRLQAMIQDALLAKGAGGQYTEAAGETTIKSYACANMRVHTRSARLDTGAPGWMRGPGASLGQFALDSAMDALAHQLGIDPLEFRLRNHADVEPDTGHAWSSKSLKACYQAAAERIGWFERDPGIGSMRSGRALVGYGMTSSLYPVLQLPAAARVILNVDGQARAQSAVHEMGQGMLTAMTQIAAEGLGLPLAQVTLDWGDTSLPFGSMTVGSMGTLTNGSAIAEAASLVRKKLLARVVNDAASPLHGANPDELEITAGRIHAPNAQSQSVAEVMARIGEPISETAMTGQTFGHSPYGRSAFGAQFAKVLVDPDTGHVQVERLIGAFAGGRIINPLLVRSQLIGGMVWGIGQALLEETLQDQRSGRWMTASLGESLIPTNADVAEVDAIITREDDTRGSPLGIKGLGEIGIVGTSAAIANAIFHATGQRLTALPMRLDRVLLGQQARA
ncbi:xanthine dehydrogenase family protein molybdopterin-binding subunit [Deinococcus sp.]|uniref:xanthine dehydrogenase family protein molybdopterin-binding subunit n=1 Tax=Deinococcus sp. TaxID=47478 RepID=UPI003B596994